MGPFSCAGRSVSAVRCGPCDAGSRIGGRGRPPTVRKRKTGVRDFFRRRGWTIREISPRGLWDPGFAVRRRRLGFADGPVSALRHCLWSAFAGGIGFRAELRAASGRVRRTAFIARAIECRSPSLGERSCAGVTEKGRGSGGVRSSAILPGDASASAESIGPMRCRAIRPTAPDPRRQGPGTSRNASEPAGRGPCGGCGGDLYAERPGCRMFRLFAKKLCFSELTRIFAADLVSCRRRAEG